MDMDMGTSTTMDMSGMTATGTATSAAAAATSSMAMSMGGMGDGDSCKISMLWNWYTVDTCFIARSWHIRSTGMFAGSCIGVILLVMSLEFLRRASKEYDRYIVRQASQNNRQITSVDASTVKAPSDGSDVAVTTRAAPFATHFRPSLLQQAIRAGFHMVQFAVAYFVMLLAMYYNGYFIICIVIGAYLGAFVFSWENIQLG
ncbi:Ctr copper transporter family protein [Rutstroemia sp. NJR-2017a BBW]|nr:Ctr copper transporter family protein [Rutstroemia sp. NJR-2017a BBW]